MMRAQHRIDHTMIQPRALLKAARLQTPTKIASILNKPLTLQDSSKVAKLKVVQEITRITSVKDREVAEKLRSQFHKKFKMISKLRAEQEEPRATKVEQLEL